MCAQPALGLASLIREERRKKGRKQGSKEAGEKKERLTCLAVQRPQIHKPSARVSFGLPDPLSVQVRSHAMVARRSGTNTRQGKRQGQAAKQPDPPSWECNAGITKIKAQEGKDEPDLRLCVLDTVDGRAQPGQYGGHHCRLGRGSARPSGCQAFLRLAAFAETAAAGPRPIGHRCLLPGSLNDVWSQQRQALGPDGLAELTERVSAAGM